MEQQCVKRVAVVGCGVSGLVAIKSCLEEGLEPTCFEMNSDIGGLWYKSDTPKPSSGPQMYDSLITNTSKSMMCFSDFPCPPDYPPYLPHQLYEQYLHSYAEHFKLHQHIKFNTKVLKVDKAEDYSTTGRWVVTTCTLQGSTENDEKMSSHFDGIILCLGFFSVPHIPHIPGLMQEFKGTVRHVGSYRNPQPFRGRTVIVVGSATSAADVACDIAPVAKQVYLSVQHGAYTISRIHNGRTPLDFSICRATLYYLPKWLTSRVLVARASRWLDPVVSGLKPKPSKPLAQIHFIINEQLPSKVMTGQVKVVAHIERMAGGTQVHLEDGSVLEEVDDIIFATGYKHDFSIIDPAFITSDPKGEKLELYKMIFPLSLPHDSLAVVGCLRTNGPIPPVLEIQARLAARVLAGRHRLPERSTMQQDVDQMTKQQLQTYGHVRYAFQYLAVADNIAAELGNKPDWWHFLLQGDVKMALALLFGPAHPFHYRLCGPHKWGGARDATFNAYRETIYSTQHRRVWEEEEKNKRREWLQVLKPLWLFVLGLVVYLIWSQLRV